MSSILFLFAMLQNTSSELNPNTDGFINSILYDDELLMDMGVNVNDGMYTTSNIQFHI